MLPNICEIQPNKVSTNLKSKVFWIHGEPGTWKTTVASKFPKALIAGFEIGYQFINGVYAVPFTQWSDLKDLQRQLKTPKAKEMYDTIVFDTISNAASMCYKYALGQLGISDPQEVGFGKGWRTIKDEWRIIRDIVKMGYCIVFISHSKETEVKDKKTNQSSLAVKTDLEGWASSDLWGLSDFVLYVRKELEEDGVTENVYAYSDLPYTDTKRRHQAFPSRFLFSFDNIMDGLNKVVEAETSAGHEVDSSDKNVREVQEEPLDKIRQDVIGLVTDLTNTSAADEVGRYIVELFQGTRISQTNESHRDKLVAARDYLIDLKNKVNS